MGANNSTNSKGVEVKEPIKEEEEKIFDVVPEELIKEILEYTPLPQLLNFRRTRKGWKDYIDSKKLPPSLFFLSSLNKNLPKTVGEFILMKQARQERTVLLLGGSPDGGTLFHQMGGGSGNAPSFICGLEFITQKKNEYWMPFLVIGTPEHEKLDTILSSKLTKSADLIILSPLKNCSSYYKEIRQKMPNVPIICMVRKYYSEENPVINENYEEICEWAKKEVVPLCTITNFSKSNAGYSFMHILNKIFSLSLDSNPVAKDIQIVENFKTP
jgi:hypothetical protein